MHLFASPIGTLYRHMCVSRHGEVERPGLLTCVSGYEPRKFVMYTNACGKCKKKKLSK